MIFRLKQNQTDKIHAGLIFTLKKLKLFIVGFNFLVLAVKIRADGIATNHSIIPKSTYLSCPQLESVCARCSSGGSAGGQFRLSLPSLASSSLISTSTVHQQTAPQAGLPSARQTGKQIEILIYDLIVPTPPC